MLAGGANTLSALRNKVIVRSAIENIKRQAGNSCLKSIIMGYRVKVIGDKAYGGCAASTVHVTAQSSPMAPNSNFSKFSTFSNYSGKRYVQGLQAADAYCDALTCWDRFDAIVMVEPSELKVDGLSSGIYSVRQGYLSKMIAVK